MSPIRPENKHRYPANWSVISLRIRFVRAKGQCECDGRCGRGTHVGRCPNVHNLPAYGTGKRVILTTAHLDHAPENCDDENLMAMCQGCHLHYDKEHHAKTRMATVAASLLANNESLDFELDTRRSALEWIQLLDEKSLSEQVDEVWRLKRSTPCAASQDESDTWIFAHPYCDKCIAQIGMVSK